jgi:hypothetical protein
MQQTDNTSNRDFEKSDDRENDKEFIKGLDTDLIPDFEFTPKTPITPPPPTISGDEGKASLITTDGADE